MGILSEFFVSTPDDALIYEELSRTTRHKLPNDRYECVRRGGFTGMELSMIWAILDGDLGGWPDRAMESVYLSRDAGSWLDRFPDALVEGLAKLDDATLTTIATQWVATEQFRGLALNTATEIISEFRHLARAAKRTSRSMYLWGSL